ncbi:hypothetical protein D3C80_1931430 [compost metagenome]
MTYAISTGRAVKKTADIMFGAVPIDNKDKPTATLLKIAWVNIAVMSPYLTKIKLNTSPMIISSNNLVVDG